MNINLLSFGNLTEYVESGLISSTELIDSDSIKVFLMDKYPQIADKKFLIAINKTIIQQNTMLNEFDTVAILPPFSGG